MDKFRILDTLNEGNPVTKARKNKAMGRDGRRTHPEGAYSSQEDAEDVNPHGTGANQTIGGARGVRKQRGAKPSATKPGRLELSLLKHKLKNKRKDESTMNQENFEAAYIRSNAQMALVVEGMFGDALKKAGKVVGKAAVGAATGRTARDVVKSVGRGTEATAGSAGRVIGATVKGEAGKQIRKEADRFKTFAKKKISSAYTGAKRKAIGGLRKVADVAREKAGLDPVREAYIRANAQIAFTIAEAMTTKVGARLTKAEMEARKPKPGHRIVTAKRAVDEPEPRVIKAK
jgi:hypothetical protein